GALYNYHPFKDYVLSQVDNMLNGSRVNYAYGSKEDFISAFHSALNNMPIFLASNYGLESLLSDRRELLFVCQCLSIKYQKEKLKFLNENSTYQANYGLRMMSLGEYDKCAAFKVSEFNQVLFNLNVTNQLVLLSGNNIDGDFLYLELLCFLDYANEQNELYSVTSFINAVRVLFSEIKKKYDFSWLDSGDAEQIRWLWNYMVEHEDFYHNIMLRDAKSYVPHDYSQSIAWFDFQLVSKPVTKYLYRNVKDAWAQVKKRRRDVHRNKKTYNFVMSTNAERCLNELKGVSGIDKNRLVEQAIEDLYEQMLGKPAN
ncbi:hypothetical protein, partial [Vibrio chagasii]|uniref:hypothetical protein n=1 Tax=Vibrio chagasii TaxID=170679 RepID=UPI0022851D45